MVRGGGAVVAGGSVTVDQAAIWTSTFYSPGRVLEFVAELQRPQPAHRLRQRLQLRSVGDLQHRPTRRPAVCAKHVPGIVDTPLGASYLDGLHRYRIEWTATSARFLIDGTQVALHTGAHVRRGLCGRPPATPMRSGSLAIDWMRMSPYPASGTFTSRVLDAGVAAVDWRAFDVTVIAPAGTGVTFEVQTGDTAKPDGSWSGFTPSPTAPTSRNVALHPVPRDLDEW